MTWLAELGQELRAARKSTGLSQAALAAQARISRSTIARLESGRLPELGATSARRLLQAVGLDLRVSTYNRGRPTLDDLVEERESGAGTPTHSTAGPT
ncbi:MAG: helix-turn-helix transcriptional regulator [Gemmatimonadota bacterium]